MSKGMGCRFCGAQVTITFADLGVTPLCQTHIEDSELNLMEPFYPLHAMVCEKCLLVQLDEFVGPSDIFEEYAYFSSYSSSWLKHAADYCEMATERFGLDSNNLVVEVASNDGYLLRNFVDAGIPALGIEPAANVAQEARRLGVESISKFFGVALAKEVSAERGSADLIIGNNVLAHVPDLNDFVSGLKILLSDGGTITMEFPHIQRLIEQVQFDTIYHEHFSYFSFLAVSEVFRHHGLEIYDVEQIPTHGGSLRIFARHSDAEEAESEVEQSVPALLAQEREAGLDKVETYSKFQKEVNSVKRNLLNFLIKAKNDGKMVVGYGAPGKGNTLLNFCGIGTDFLDYTVDRNPYKQGKYTPGTRIPIKDPAVIKQTRPDFVLILPWNLRKEISSDCAYISEWGGQFVVPIPALEVFGPATNSS